MNERREKVRMINCAVVMSVLLTFAAFGKANAEEQLEGWYQWRGSLATGAAPNANPPVEWGEGKNIRWKVSSMTVLRRRPRLPIGSCTFADTKISTALLRRYPSCLTLFERKNP